MKILISLVLTLTFSETTLAKCQFDWAGGSFNAELSKPQLKAFKTYWDKNGFILGRIQTVAGKPKAPANQLILQPIHGFKKRLQNNGNITVKSHQPSSLWEKGDLWVFPIGKLTGDTMTLPQNACGRNGFPLSQKAVFYEFQQLAGFSLDAGLDQWLTCETSDDCAFFKTCMSCFRSINQIYATQFLNWKKQLNQVACKSCETAENFSEKYRPVCTAAKICDKELRKPE